MSVALFLLCCLFVLSHSQRVQVCKAGQYSTIDKCQNCSVGKYMDLLQHSQSFCINCPSGQYQKETGKGSCSKCEAGQVTVGGKSCRQCTPGTFSKEEGGTACQECRVGTFSSSDRTFCEDCPNGWYQNIPRTPQCNKCPVGFQQDKRGQAACSQCLPGSFQSDRGSYLCINCPSGKYQDQAGSETCHRCESTQYTHSEMSTSCLNCPSTGHCCRGWGSNGTLCQPCSAGSHRNSSSNKCEVCKPGKRSARSTSALGDNALGYDTCEDCDSSTFSNGANCVSDGNDCSMGTVANSETNHCEPCGKGRYRATGGGSVQCSNSSETKPDTDYTGSKCVYENSATCTSCPVGWITSRLGQISCQPCAAGQTSNSDRTQCQPCPGTTKSRLGSACGDTCSNYSRNDTESPNKCDTCADGKYFELFPNASSVCSNCPNGWIKSKTVIGSEGQCVKCPENSPRLVNDVNRSQCVECAAGQQTASETCALCTGGKFKQEGDSMCRDCESGQYQSELGQSHCVDCPTGQYQDASNQQDCDRCMAGQYSETAGQASCVDCPIGWGNSNNRTHCTDMFSQKCTLNYTCTQCPVGEEMTGTTDYRCTLCVPGKFRNETASSKCQFCPAQKYQSQSGQADCQLCTSPDFSTASNIAGEGFISCGNTTSCRVGEGDADCNTCTSGKYSLGGIGATCKWCPAGFISTPGMKKCTTCTSGQAPNAEKTTCENCTVGRASTYGTTCTDCPIGQISERVGSSTCTQCEGFRSTDAVGSSTCTPCGQGFDIVQNGRCSYCPIGQLRLQTTDCTVCQSGQEIVQEYGQSKCVNCQAGKYMDDNLHSCQSCPVGYTTVAGQTECELCAGSCAGLCPKGHFVRGSTCQTCPQGYVSFGNRQTFCSQCTAGREQPSAGQSTCNECAPGKYSEKTVNVHCDLCPRGQYQHMRKQGKCNDCRQGKYTDLIGQRVCKNCPLGQYIESLGAVAENCLNCPAGWQGIADGQCAQCPESTWQNEEGQQSCKECTPFTQPLSPPGATEETQCFEGKGLVTYVFDVESDAKESGVYKSQCEIRPNMVLLCPGCSCNDNSRDGYWDGPVCDECMHGFAGGRVGKCLIKCPGYDGVHDSTICSGNGKCWFGKYGSGECLCGGNNLIDASSDNIVVNVKICPAGQRCLGYGPDVVERTQYIPFYYILEYRQYSVFVLQLNLYTPTRGHMWFTRYSPHNIYENVCATCTGSYDGSPYTQIGYFSEKKTDYRLFEPNIQIRNGFHGENCQHECAVCLNSGHCLHTPHSLYYSYSIESTTETFSEVFVPTTQCRCSSDIFDSTAMCCPHGFEPYIYFGKRQVDPYFHHTALPFITNVVNTRQSYWTNEDLWLQNIYPNYEASQQNRIQVSNINLVYDETATAPLGNGFANFLQYGPYTKHTFYGTENEICRACPGLFGKGVVSRSAEITSEQLAEDFWWDTAAKGKKCNGLGVCDFYLQRLEEDVLFMGEFQAVDQSKKYTLEKRFTGCKDTSNSRDIGTFPNSSCFVKGSTKIAEEQNEQKCTGNYAWYTPIEQCLRKANATSGMLMIAEAYTVSEYIGTHSIKLDDNTDDKPVKEKDATAPPTQPWGYLEKDGIYYKTIQTKGYTSIPKPDANGDYLFHPWDEGKCRAFTTCQQTHNTLYSIYNYGHTGQGDDRSPATTFDRFDTCFTYDDGTFKTKIGNYVTETYENGQDPFLGKNCPKGHFCTKTGEADSIVGFKEACPPGYYQPDEAKTRTDPKSRCSHLSVRELTPEYKNTTEKYCKDIGSGWGKIEKKEQCTNSIATLSNLAQTRPRGCYIDDGTVYFNKEISNVACSSAYECTCLNYVACQLNKATAEPNDLVDSVCRRCKSGEYSRAGSAACTACPTGRVKKVSGLYGAMDIGTLTMLNMPSNQYTSTPWYFIPIETGEQFSDCAQVPNGIIHVPKANAFRNYDVNSFLPVVSCPFGYSSRPGTYVISGHTQVVNELQKSAENGRSFMTAPFIQPVSSLNGNGLGNERSVALDYCFRCPTNSMTGGGSMTCATCYENSLKEYLKSMIDKLIDVDNLIDVNSWKAAVKDDRAYRLLAALDKKGPRSYSVATPIELDMDSDIDWAPSHDFYNFQLNDTSKRLELADALLVCNTFQSNWTQIGFTKVDALTATVTCGVANGKPVKLVLMNELNICSSFQTVSVPKKECLAKFIQQKGYEGYTGTLLTTTDCKSPQGCMGTNYNNDQKIWWNDRRSSCPEKTDLEFSGELYWPGVIDRDTGRDLQCPTTEATVQAVTYKTGQVYSDWRDSDCGPSDVCQYKIEPGCLVKSYYKGRCPGDDARYGGWGAAHWYTIGDEDICKVKSFPHFHCTIKNECLCQYPPERGVNTDYVIYNKVTTEVNGVGSGSSFQTSSWSTVTFPLCTACSPGMSKSGGKCEACAEGQYTATFQDAAAGYCRKCPAGFQGAGFQFSGRRSCQACSAGFYTDEDKQSKCKGCAVGKFQSNSKSTACKNCAVGKYSSITSQTKCEDCLAGTEWTAVSTKCTDCVEGKFKTKTSEALACKTCTNGQYQNDKGSKQCKKCPSGHSHGSAVRCIECETGFYYSRTGASVCTKCPSGKYQDSKGQSECKDCEDGHSCSDTKSVKCNAGKFSKAVQEDSQSVVCNDCLPGLYSENAGSKECTQCGDNAISIPEQAGTRCQECGGETWESSFDKSIIKDGFPNSHGNSFSLSGVDDFKNAANHYTKLDCSYTVAPAIGYGTQYQQTCEAEWNATFISHGKLCFTCHSCSGLSVYVAEREVVTSPPSQWDQILPKDDYSDRRRQTKCSTKSYKEGDFVKIVIVYNQYLGWNGHWNNGNVVLSTESDHRGLFTIGLFDDARCVEKKKQQWQWLLQLLANFWTNLQI